MNIKNLLPDTVNRWLVTPQEASMRLVDYLVLKQPELSASAWRKQIDAQSVWLNTGPARLATREVEAYDVILHSSFVEKQWEILSKESEFWVLDKPLGCGYETGKNFLIRQGFNPLPVHRLDSMTTGLLIMAQTVAAQEYFESLFRNRRMSKQYLAVVWGEPKTKSGTITARLQENASRHGGVRVEIAASGEKGVEAITDWTCLASAGGISFLRCEPRTGRTHQIRAHLNYAGFPIVGDREYLPQKPSRGLRGNIFANQHLLHSYELSFEWNKELRSWRSPLKDDMKRFAKVLKVSGIDMVEDSI